jgi:hypothetical protein
MELKIERLCHYKVLKIKDFERGFFYQKLGFELEHFDAALFAIALVGISSVGFATRFGSRFFRRGGATRSRRRFGLGAVVGGLSQPLNARLAQAVAVHLVHTHPDRSGQQRSGPKPDEYFVVAHLKMGEWANGGNWLMNRTIV